MDLNKIHEAMNKDRNGQMPDAQQDYRSQTNPIHSSDPQIPERQLLGPMKPNPAVVGCPHYTSGRASREGNIIICDIKYCPHGKKEPAFIINAEQIYKCKTNGQIGPQGLKALLVSTEED